MTFKPPPAILQRVLRFKALKHEQGGKLSLWGTPGVLNTNITESYLQRIIERVYGEKDCMSIFYTLGRFQGRDAFRMISKNFGYAETFRDKKKLLEFQTGQSSVVGRGDFSWEVMDFKKNIFVAKGVSPHAEEYRKSFGMHKFPVDHFLRGVTAAFIEETIKKKVFCVENRCVASGNKYCELVTKPVGVWDKKDKRFNEQLIKEMPDLRELGAKE
jgi:predicted hydrocarbon binding protein